jgi:hypothetical protein
LENNYIYSFCYKELNEKNINAYEIMINIDYNNIYKKCISDGICNFYIEKYNDYNIISKFNVYHKTNFKYIFDIVYKNYITKLDKNITNYIQNNNYRYFEHKQNKNILSFKTNDLVIFYQDKTQYVSIKKNNCLHIKYVDNYVVDLSETFYINYIKDYNTKLTTKIINVNNKICFDSEIYINGFAHKINKLYCNFENFENFEIKSKELPYFLFDKNCDKNLLTVYAFNEPSKYIFLVNLFDINSSPVQYEYIIDNFGKLFSKKIKMPDLNIIEFYNSDNKIIIEEIKFNNTDEENKIKKNIYNSLLNDIVNCNESEKIINNLKIHCDIFNKEHIITTSDYVYKFIINCGQTGDINNIAIVAETGVSTHDISKIILKQDGTVEIVRTNNNNQLIVKSSTRNNFEGNVGYKFAISENIPCVISLEIPDDAEVIFDHYHNKFRCNKCIVKDIQPIQNNKVKEMENICSICLTEKPNVMFSPCQHVGCHTCIASISANKCHICSKIIESYITLQQDIVNEKMNIQKANSAIYCSDFEYKIGQEIIINDFEISQYWKCSNGIHFHNKIEDVYNWLEYIDIPDNLEDNVTTDNVTTDNVTTDNVIINVD